MTYVAVGDDGSNLMCVGRFDDPAAGIEAAARASIYDSVSSTGEIVCELDDDDED